MSLIFDPSQVTFIKSIALCTTDEVGTGDNRSQEQSSAQQITEISPPFTVNDFDNKYAERVTEFSHYLYKSEPWTWEYFLRLPISAEFTYLLMLAKCDNQESWMALATWWDKNVNLDKFWHLKVVNSAKIINFLTSEVLARFTENPTSLTLEQFHLKSLTIANCIRELKLLTIGNFAEWVKIPGKLERVQTVKQLILH